MSKFIYYQTPDKRLHRMSNPIYSKDWGQLTTKEGEVLYKMQCIADLLEIIKKGQTVYTILRNRSASGMQRSISCVVIVNDSIVHLLNNLSVQ